MWKPDWSSDVCSSDLLDYENVLFFGWPAFVGIIDHERFNNFMQLAFAISTLCTRNVTAADIRLAKSENIGRASCRRGDKSLEYVSIDHSYNDMTCHDT